MGRGFALLPWFEGGVFIAAIAAAALASAVGAYTQGVKRGRRRAIAVAALFPYVCLIWVGALVIFRSITDMRAPDLPLGARDVWRCTLPNGYRLLMVNVTDQGWIYNPNTQRLSNFIFDQEDAVSGVQMVRVEGPYILGRSDRRSAHSDFHQNDQYFLVDTRTGRQARFLTYDALRDAALQAGVGANLETIYSVYSRNRSVKSYILFGLAMCVPPLLLGGLIFRWITRLKIANRFT